MCWLGIVETIKCVDYSYWDWQGIVIGIVLFETNFLRVCSGKEGEDQLTI